MYPKVYREAMRTALAADPTVIDLHRNGPYYYSVGVSLLHFNLKESENLARTLIEVMATVVLLSKHMKYNFKNYQIPFPDSVSKNRIGSYEWYN